MTLSLNFDDIDMLTLGSALLGSGGGGNANIGGLLLKTAMKNFHSDSIELVDPSKISNHSQLICSSGMGSPTIGAEKLPSGKEYDHALRKLENSLGHEFDYISPIEIGGVNSIVPFVTSLFRGLPVMDGDGEGRAFPELQMTTFNLYGIPSMPMCLVDERGNELVINAMDNDWAEKISRSVTSRFGGRGYLANYPMNGTQYRKSVIPNSVSRAVDLGRLLSEGSHEGNAEERLLDEAGARKLFDGKLVDLVRDNRGGFSIGYALFRSEMGGMVRTSRIRFQNEYLFYDEEENGMMSEKVCTPQIICVLDSETYVPLTTDRLRYGIRCKIYTLPVSEKWNHPGAMKLIGREAFKVLDSI